MIKKLGGVTFAVQINFLFLHVFGASSFELPTELPEISQEKKPSWISTALIRLNRWWTFLLVECFFEEKQPGDPMWPFYPLVEGHLTLKGSLNHPKKGTFAELLVQVESSGTNGRGLFLIRIISIHLAAVLFFFLFGGEDFWTMKQHQ